MYFEMLDTLLEEEFRSQVDENFEKLVNDVKTAIEQTFNLHEPSRHQAILVLDKEFEEYIESKKK